MPIDSLDQQIPAHIVIAGRRADGEAYRNVADDPDMATAVPAGNATQA